MTADRRALIVAVDDYADAGLRRLLAPASDAAALAEALAAPGVGDFTVDVVRNGTAQEIRVSVEDFFADARPDDLLLLHFSGHGLKNAGGELFLAAADSRPDRLASTAVAADFVNRQMAESRAQRIALFLDCCYGGAFPRGMVVRGAGDVQVREAFAETERSSGGRGRVVVTASSAVEYAFEGAELAPGALPEPSVFTGALVRGLTTGDADRDGDGWVGLHELFGYVTEQVRRATPHQTPHLWAFGSEGELLIAHSGRRTISARTPAAELLEAAGSPLPATRMGVALELREMLVGPDVPLALGAWEALTRMLGDDSRRVDDAVHAALGACELHLDPAELAVVVGDTETTQDVQLGGPPLARAVVATVDEPWLRAVVDDAVLRVTVTPGADGSGSILLTSPVSTCSLTVRAVKAPAGGRTPGRRGRRPGGTQEAAVEAAPAVPESAPPPAPERPAATPRRSGATKPATTAAALPPAAAPEATTPESPGTSPRSTPVWITLALVVVLVGIAVLRSALVDPWGEGYARARTDPVLAAILALLLLVSLTRPALGSVALGAVAGGLFGTGGFGLFMVLSNFYDEADRQWWGVVGASAVGIALVVVALATRGDLRPAPRVGITSRTALVLLALGVAVTASALWVTTEEFGTALVVFAPSSLVLVTSSALVVAMPVLVHGQARLHLVSVATAYAYLAVLGYEVVSWLGRNDALDAPTMLIVAGAAVLAVATFFAGRAPAPGTRQAGPEGTGLSFRGG